MVANVEKLLIVCKVVEVDFIQRGLEVVVQGIFKGFVDGVGNDVGKWFDDGIYEYVNCFLGVVFVIEEMVNFLELVFEQFCDFFLVEIEVFFIGEQYIGDEVGVVGRVGQDFNVFVVFGNVGFYKRVLQYQCIKGVVFYEVFGKEVQVGVFLRDGFYFFGFDFMFLQYIFQEGMGR